tara:strand:- start:514 stop:1128 length:615 start_codon:yes stop_codon:yes gene_type:complete
MKIEELLKELHGLQTIQSVQTLLKVDKKKATYYIHRLRKKGYVKTWRHSNKKRVYHISYKNQFKGMDYYDIINKYSPIKLTHPVHRIYDRAPSMEETLVFAIKTRDIRTIIASLALFKKINNWPLLFKIAKQNNLRREVGALYDVARTIIKTRRMTKRFRTLSTPKKEKKRYIVQGSKSKHFQEIENKWKVYIPLNKADLEEYK